MKQNSINFRDGRIVFNDLNQLFKKSLIGQDYLKEDILLVEYNNKLLDVGFYGDNNFHSQIIECENWETPIYLKVLNDISKETIIQEIKKAIDLI